MSSSHGKRALTIRDFGPSRKGFCRACGAPIPPKSGRRTTCSHACGERVNVLCWWNIQKSRAEKRDAWVCQLCGFDMGKLRRIVSRGMYLPGPVRRRWNSQDSYFQFVSHSTKEWLRGIIGSWKPEVDHIVPVCEGGGVRPDMTAEQVLANLRTLCHECHRAETARLAARRAEKRRNERPLPLLEGT